MEDALQLLVFACLQAGCLDLLVLKLRKLDLFIPDRFIFVFFRIGFQCTPISGICFSDLFFQRRKRCARKIIQKIQMILLTDKILMLSLSIEVKKNACDLF